MGKVWVLDTETKGTGANVVPLERARQRTSPTEPVLVQRAPRPREQSERPPEPKRHQRFRIVEVTTLQTLADDANAREVAEVMKNVRSIVDVNVFVWQDRQQRWQMLPLSDVRSLWELARAGT